MRALVIDDSPATRIALRRMLQRLGLSVREAVHGADALEILDKEPGIDLVLVDWRMPVMDGLAFLRALRRRAGAEALPVVMMSSETAPERMSRAREAGATDYLAKPCTEASLRALLASHGLHS